MHACERCHSRKTKCDRRLPKCTSCTKSQSLCHYSNKRRDRQVQQEYLKSIELRLQELEQENERLKERTVSQNKSTLPHVDGCRLSQLGVPQSHLSENRLHVDEPRPNETQQSPASAESHQRTPGEEARYLGSSNGVDFVDVVERVVDSSHAGGLFGRVTDSHRIRDRVAFPAIPQPASIVEKGLAMPLIRAYFEHWHLTFPLLYRPTFMQMVEDMYSDPTVYQQNSAYAFAFDIVLALGSVPSKRVEWGLSDAEVYFARALTHLDEVSSFRDIRSLQALLLYCKYGIHASLRDTSGEMWEVLGKATRLVVEAGLHQNSATASPRCETHITGLLPVSVRVEMQRRTFWCYYNLERIVNISLGRPLAIHDDDIHVPLPSADAVFNQTTMNEAVSSSQTISPFLHHIQLRKIQSKIHRSMYTSRSIQTLPLRERQNIRREIFSELQAWQRDISLLHLPGADQPSEISSSFQHPSWYQALYHSGCLMLFRPSATFPAMEGLETDEDIDDVLQMIWTSSRFVLTKYFELLRAHHLNYSWVCLYTIFMAGLANVYGVGCCAQRRKRGILAFLPSFLDVISDFRDCSNILTAICERWHDARGSCDIFTRLSMSALKELTAVTFQQKPDGIAGEKSDVGDGEMTANPQPGLVASQAQSEPVQAVSPDQTGQIHTALGTADMTVPIEHYPEDPFAEFYSIVDFQQLFQEMQNSVHTRDNGEMMDEVSLGFSQEWFER